MATNVIVQEHSLRVQLLSDVAKRCQFWIRLLQPLKADRVGLGPMGSALKGRHDLLKARPETFIWDRFSVGSNGDSQKRAG